MKRHRRDRWEHDIAARQQNSEPLNTAMNEGLFYGLLLRGGKRLTSTQRIGALLVGFFPLAAGVLIIYGALFRPDDYGSPLLSFIVNTFGLVIGIALSFIGFRMWKNALSRT